MSRYYQETEEIPRSHEERRSQSQYQDHLIAEEMVKMVKELFRTQQGGLRNLFCVIILRLCKSIPHYLLLLLIKHYLTYSEELIATLQSFAQKLFVKTCYRRKFITHTKNDNNYFFVKQLDKYVTDSPYSLTIVKKDEGSEVYYLPWYHNSYLVEAQRQAEKSFALRHKIEDRKFYQAIKSFNGACQPETEDRYVLNLFPCTNYRKLTKGIKTQISIAQQLGQCRMIPILLNGQPGLGKTRFLDYAVQKDLLQEVYLCDMSSFLHLPFNSIVDDLLRFITTKETSLLFVLDELDKYFNNCDTWLTAKHNDDTTHEEFMQRNFFDLLRLLEFSGLNNHCVLIFCANNFDKLFVNIAETSDHYSLQTRFINFVFHPCDRDELVAYYHYYCQLLTYMQDQDTWDNMEKLLLTLPDDFTITYRELDHLNFKYSYSLVEIITHLK